MRIVIRMVLLVSALAALALGMTLATGCGSSSSGDGGDGYNTPPSTKQDTAGGGDENTIVMKDIQFDPQEITISAGTTVTWTNEDPVDHNVTADDGSFDSGNLGKGESFSHTFDQPGTYEYKCTLHPPNMKGTVIVE